MSTKNRIYILVVVVIVLVLFQTVFVCGNVSDYGEECNYTAECIDHRMICSFNKSNVSVCLCDRFHEWRDNMTGCAQKYNFSFILDRVILSKDVSGHRLNNEGIFFAQKVAGYFVLCICGLALVIVLSYCCYVKKTDLALKKSLKRTRKASESSKSKSDKFDKALSLHM